MQHSAHHQSLSEEQGCESELSTPFRQQGRCVIRRAADGAGGRAEVDITELNSGAVNREDDDKEVVRQDGP